MLKRFFTNIRKTITAFLSVRVLDDKTDTTFLQQGQSLDRLQYDREDIINQSLEAWRLNPLARRLVELTSQYVIGSGIAFSAGDDKTSKVLKEFWDDDQNKMASRLTQLCDELTRTGDLFILFSVDRLGNSYVRCIPSISIQKIDSRKNDLEQETYYHLKPEEFSEEGKTYPAFNKLKKQRYFIRHYSINRVAGCSFGESDLAPLLKWIARYSAWLEDRARLNRYRNSFLYVIYAKFAGEADRKQRQNELNATPPSPGSMLVVNDTEKWEVLNPQLESSEANEDGLALKKMIASGAGTPLHFLAEPESSTRTTAESAGGPTYRRFEQRQQTFISIVDDILKTVLKVKSLHLPEPLNRDIKITYADISARDNAQLAIASLEVVNAFSKLRDRGLIDDAEYLRISYRFAGEVIDLEDMLTRGAAAGKVKNLNPDIKKTGNPEATPAGTSSKINPDTGDLKGGNNDQGT